MMSNLRRRVAISHSIRVAAVWALLASSAAAQPAMVPADLGTLGGNSSVPYGLSASGQVVGASDPANGLGHAFSWTRAGGMVAGVIALALG